jgi:hypothetical protein
MGYSLVEKDLLVIPKVEVSFETPYRAHSEIAITSSAILCQYTLDDMVIKTDPEEMKLYCDVKPNQSSFVSDAVH